MSRKSCAFLASLWCQCKVCRSLCAENYVLTVSVLHAEYYYDTGISLGHHERHAKSQEYLQARHMPALPLIHSICVIKCGRLPAPLCMHGVWCPIDGHPDAIYNVSTQLCRGHEVHQDQVQRVLRAYPYPASLPSVAASTKFPPWLLWQGRAGQVDRLQVCATVLNCPRPAPGLLKLQRGLYTMSVCHFWPVWLPLTGDERMPNWQFCHQGCQT